MVEIKFLKGILLFASFSDRELFGIARVAKEKAYAKGKTFFKEGQKAGALYIIASGEVAIEKQPLIKTTDAVATLYLREGDFFGELSIFDKGLRTSTARALLDTTVVVLGQEALLRLSKNPIFGAKFFRNMLQVIASRIRQTNSELMAFYEIGKLLSLSHNEGALLEKVLKIIISALKARSGIFLLKNKVTGMFEVKCAQGYEGSRGLQELNIANSGLALETLKQGRPLVIADLFKDPLFKDLARLGYEKKTMLFFPFGPCSERPGLLILAGKALTQKEENIFTQNDLNLLYAVMQQVQVILENIQFYSDIEGRDKLKRQYVSF